LATIQERGGRERGGGGGRERRLRFRISILLLLPLKWANRNEGKGERKERRKRPGLCSNITVMWSVRLREKRGGNGKKKKKEGRVSGGVESLSPSQGPQGRVE